MKSPCQKKHVIWHSHEHLWQPSIVHKLLACTSLNIKDLDDSAMSERIIAFATEAHDDSGFTSDDIFLDDELCFPFSTSLFSHHVKDIIQDVLQGSANFARCTPWF